MKDSNWVPISGDDNQRTSIKGDRFGAEHLLAFPAAFRPISSGSKSAKRVTNLGVLAGLLIVPFAAESSSYPAQPDRREPP